DLRVQFNQESAVYAKVLLSEELLNVEQRKQLQTQHDDYLEHLQRVQSNEFNALKVNYDALLHHKERLLSVRDEYHQQALDELEQAKQRLLNEKLNHDQQVHQYSLERKGFEADLERLRREKQELRLKVINLAEAPQRQLANELAATKAKKPAAELKAAKAKLELIEKSGLFDPIFYQATYLARAPLNQSALEHYYFIGAKQGYNPNFLFDTAWYLKQHSELLTNQENPLVHYLTLGAKAHSQPHPLFDGKWYLDHYADVREGQMNPLWHYLKHGSTELRNPNPLFLSAYYVAEYPEIQTSSLSPLAFYLQYGVDWQADPHPLFDSRYYLRQIGEALPEGVSALGHYLNNKHYWRTPSSACFDGSWYLDEYWDVQESEVNPLVHYTLYGAQDGRQPHPQAAQNDFILRYQAKFAKLGIKLVAKTPLANQPTQPASATKPFISKSLEHLLSFEEQVLTPPSSSFIRNQLTIHWVTCDFARQGGGGNMTIFRFVRLFELFGHKQHIWLHNQ
ncbi:MAG TPA: hypothetical protein PLM98_15920, partial [Thiolinea sp.]|nr:hypothetical protein [Thiolinea sp.]